MDEPAVPITPDPQFDAFAAREPYFAVLTAPRYLSGQRTAADEREFFATGETLVAWLSRVIDAGLSPGFAPMSTLEYGCGLGRLAVPLARRPGSVTAVDRSPVMLDLAKREAERRGLDHIVFHTPDQLFAASWKFDLVVCYHVLQRMRRAEGIALVRRLLSLVGPRGIGVFQWPYRSSESTAVAASRWIRERVPGANAVANLARGKSAGAPFIPTHRYDLAAMLALFDEAGFRSTHLVLEDDGDLGYATVLAQRHARTTGVRSTATPADDETARSSSHLPATVSDAEIDRFNLAAEAYFSTLTDWEHHLAKPFSQPDEAPALLANLSTVLHALRLSAGLTVIDFGAGTGWLSRALTQLGCRAILVDVSPTALAIARELYRRQPPTGTPPAPQFLDYDGRRIDLPDASVDRIVCFDAFHHSPNPDAMIREFGRLLKPGGRAVFAEPGPRHSESARSQFEARTYGVVENDVDVHAIWRVARACGFVDLKMSVFHEPEHAISLREYEDLLAGGAAQDAWMASTRLFLHDVRNFVLVKDGAEQADSRTSSGLACDIRATPTTVAVVAGRRIDVDVTVTNTGTAIWLTPGAWPGGVSVGAHLYDASGTLIDFDWQRTPLTDPPRDIAPGETINRRLTLPPLAHGRYLVEIDCVADEVTWFALAGSKPARVVIDVTQG